jgi:hypothetical protein
VVLCVCVCACVTRPDYTAKERKGKERKGKERKRPHPTHLHVHNHTYHAPLHNTPGTCLPICLAGYALRLLGVRRVKVVFIESFCRVQSLSLTGRLLYYLADRFVVQWPGLVDR